MRLTSNFCTNTPLNYFVWPELNLFLSSLTNMGANNDNCMLVSTLNSLYNWMFLQLLGHLQDKSMIVSMLNG